MHLLTPTGYARKAIRFAKPRHFYVSCKPISCYAYPLTPTSLHLSINYLQSYALQRLALQRLALQRLALQRLALQRRSYGCKANRST